MGFLIVLVFFVMTRKFSRYYDSNMRFSMHVLASEYISILLLAILLIGAPNDTTKILETKFFQNLGQYSFGIYLWHIICIDIVKYLIYFLAYIGFVNKLSHTEKLVILFGLSYLSGCLFFHLIENPCVKLAAFLCNKLSGLSFFKNSRSEIETVLIAE